MNTQIFKVISQGEAQQIQKQDGSVLQKCPIVLQEFGERGDYGKMVAWLLGNAAQLRFREGDAVVARLCFTTHDYEGRTYQDVAVMSIEKLNH